MTESNDDGVANVGRRPFAEMVATIAVAYLSRNPVAPGDLGKLIHTIQTALRMALEDEDKKTPRTPSVSIKNSFGDDFLICLEDGKRLQMLKRYLRTHHNMTPEEYRAKWGLPRDYPMITPAYKRMRSSHAKKIGLGTIPDARGRRRSLAAE